MESFHVRLLRNSIYRDKTIVFDEGELKYDNNLLCFMSGILPNGSYDDVDRELGKLSFMTLKSVILYCETGIVDFNNVYFPDLFKASLDLKIYRLTEYLLLEKSTYAEKIAMVHERVKKSEQIVDFYPFLKDCFSSIVLEDVFFEQNSKEFLQFLVEMFRLAPYKQYLQLDLLSFLKKSSQCFGSDISVFLEFLHSSMIKVNEIPELRAIINKNRINIDQTQVSHILNCQDICSYIIKRDEKMLKIMELNKEMDSHRRDRERNRERIFILKSRNEINRNPPQYPNMNFHNFDSPIPTTPITSKPLRTLQIQILMLGANNVGKSTLAFRYISRVKPEGDLRALGPLYSFPKQTTIGNNTLVSMNIHDITSQSQADSIRQLYYIICNSFIIVFSHKYENSLDHAINTYIQVCEKKGTKATPSVFCYNDFGEINETYKNNAISRINQLGCQMITASGFDENTNRIDLLFQTAIQEYRQTSIIRETSLN